MKNGVNWARYTGGESWHVVTHATLADYTGSKPCTPRPHLLSRPKKNMCFLLCSLSRYEDWYGTPAKKKLFMAVPSCTCLSSNLFQAHFISSFITRTFCQKWHIKYLALKKKKRWMGKNTSAHRVMVVKRARAMSVPFGKTIYIGQRMTANKY